MQLQLFTPVFRTTANKLLLSVVLATGLFQAARAEEPKTVSPYEEQAKLIRAPRALGTLGENLFGDKVNYYSGSLEFVQNDVTLPGNSSLPVAMGRRVRTGAWPFGTTHFGGWDMEIPHLHGMFSKARGWDTSTASLLRCSQFSPPSDLRGSQGSRSSWKGTEFWHGSFLYIPGIGDQELLRRSEHYASAPNGQTGAYPVVTSKNWAVSCLPAMAPGNGGAGEAFLVIAPDGTQYRFDWMVSRPASRLEKATPAPQDLDAKPTAPRRQPDAEHILDRSEVWILPTLITDRFGNTVTYNYNPSNKWQLTSIVGDDAPGNPRTLTLTYQSASSTPVSTVADGTRTWQYFYNGANQLASVVLPDGSAWQLEGIAPLLADIRYTGGGDCQDPGVLNTYASSGSMVHPSGARGDFTLTPIRHGRAGVPYECIDVEQEISYAKYPNLFDTYALTSKTISGPGISPLNWSLSYSLAQPSWAPCNDCVTFKQVEVLDPAGNRTRYTFGTLFQETEGLLQQTELLDRNGTAIRTTQLRYAEPVQPFGVSDQRRGDGVMAARMKQVDKRLIYQQGVLFGWDVHDFDDFARPVTVTRSNNLGFARTETTSYSDHSGKWILGQVGKIVEARSGKVMVDNSYNSTTANLESVSKFENLEHSMTYHPDGTLATRKDRLNQTTTYEDYKRGIPGRITYADGSWESAVVNDIGLIKSLTLQISREGETATTAFDYDAMGRVSRITHPGGDEVQWNPTDIRLDQVWEPEYGLGAGHWRQIVTTGSAIEVNYLDALWRPVYTDRWDQADRNSTARFVERQYDFAGRTIYESYPRRAYSEPSAGVHQQHDALGRPTVRMSDSELGPLYDGFTYGDGFQKWYVDARQNSTRYTYQVFDEPNENAISTISMPENVFVEIRRDLYGKPLAVTRSGNGKSATRSYVYDRHERLCKTIEPEIGATVQDYDAANNVAWRAIGLNLLANSCDTSDVPEAKKTSYRYDERNRLWKTAYADGSPGITRTYTPDGLPETITSGGTAWTYRYNKRRLNTSESLAYGGATYNIGRHYDSNGSLTWLTYPGNFAVAYNPDALNQPRQVGEYASGIGYHANGAVRGFTYGNGIVRSMSQNLRGLPEWSVDTGILRDKYEYDRNGNVVLIADWHEGISNRTLDYDALNRLRLARAPSMWGDAWYGYDALDNLVSTQITGGATARTVTNTFDPITNRLTNIRNSAGQGYTFDYDYDSQGNITKRGAQRFEFDQANRLKSAVGKGTYVYDGLGRRVSTVGSDGVNRISVYSQEGKLMFTGVAGTPQESGHKYVYLHNHMIAEVGGNGGVIYMHTDGLGSPVAVTDYQGKIISRTRYEPYGATADGTTGAIGFTGHVNAGDLGLVYMQQRFYDPVAGRFLGVDPVTTNTETADSFNRYSYANNNPYYYQDVDGRSSTPVNDPYISTPPPPTVPTPVVLPPLPGLPPVVPGGTVPFPAPLPPSAPTITVPIIGGKLNAGFEAWKLEQTLKEIYKNSWVGRLESMISVMLNRMPDIPYRGPPGEWIDGKNRSRKYGPDGKPEIDLDKPHQGHERPHVHEWDKNGVREHPGRDYSPLPSQ